MTPNLRVIKQSLITSEIFSRFDVFATDCITIAILLDLNCIVAKLWIVSVGEVVHPRTFTAPFSLEVSSAGIVRSGMLAGEHSSVE